MLERIAPPFSARRMFAKLAVEGLREPHRLRSRVNRHNLRELARFRRVKAQCPMCGHIGWLLYELPDLTKLRAHHIEPRRETLRCLGCKAKMRDRTIAAGLLEVLADRFAVRADTIEGLAGELPPDLRILDTDARSRIARRLADVPDVICSLYDADVPNGAALGDEGAVNVDLEHMPFPDDSFDVIITSEVMEHVRHVEVAHREIARCLRPGGVYLFTVPYDPDFEHTWRLIDPETDEPLVLPMHLHGDPGLRPTGIKSYRVFGRDIIDQLRSAGLDARFVPIWDPARGIFDGDLFSATPTKG